MMSLMVTMIQEISPIITVIGKISLRGHWNPQNLSKGHSDLNTKGHFDRTISLKVNGYGKSLLKVHKNENYWGRYDFCRVV